jgi:hypothetical protein
MDCILHHKKNKLTQSMFEKKVKIIFYVKILFKVIKGPLKLHSFIHILYGLLDVISFFRNVNIFNTYHKEAHYVKAEYEIIVLRILSAEER